MSGFLSARNCILFFISTWLIWDRVSTRGTWAITVTVPFHFSTALPEDLHRRAAELASRLEEAGT